MQHLTETARAALGPYALMVSTLSRRADCGLSLRPGRTAAVPNEADSSELGFQFVAEASSSQAKPNRKSKSPSPNKLHYSIPMSYDAITLLIRAPQWTVATIDLIFQALTFRGR
jgi:hypothetical protein